MKKTLLVTLLSAGALFSSAAVLAAPTVYTTDSAFLSAAGAGLTFEGFETATTSGSGTSVAFAGGTFSCAGTAFCPGFFGTSNFSDTGIKSVFFATPDSATFTFNSAINSFGIAIGGAGDVAPITLTASLSNGDTATALNNYSGSFNVFGANRQYFGVIDTTSFTSVTFHASNANDGIFFDTMNYGVAAAVPEPETYAMLMAGLGLVSTIARRKKQAAA